MDYHLRMPVVTDNPKKLAKFDFIRVIPQGKEYAVYLQHHTFTFFPKNSSIPATTLAIGNNHEMKGVPQMLFFCTQVKASFFVVTDIVVYQNKELLTNEDRIRTMGSVFKQGTLSQFHQRKSSRENRNGNRRTNLVDPNFENLSFHPTHLFGHWNDFAKGSLHIPYEIKHLEYCFFKENLSRQTNRFIYILNKKVIKKYTHDTDLVYTTSREFRVDVLRQQQPQPQPCLDFKTSVLTNQPYANVLGYSHLDKQEESEEEDE